eukprot:COSAG02_NODE_21_length_53083_cov_95.733618_41_plen_131_part_00
MLICGAVDWLRTRQELNWGCIAFSYVDTVCSLCGQVIPGAGSDVGLRGDAFMDAVISITANDDERPDPVLEEQVVQSLLTASASDCKELAAQVSTRLSVPDARVKIKTLQLILNCLTSKHRTAVRNQIAD